MMSDQRGHASPGERRQLVRALGVVPAASVILANVIGTGVFVKARVMTCNVGTPGMVLTVWLVAGLLSLAGALLYAELGTMMPRSGGEFHFIGAAYGRRWAFLYGWSKSVTLGASQAAVAILFVVFFNDLVGGTLPPLAIQLGPVLVIVLATWLNLFSTRSSGLVATVLTVVKVLLVLGLGVGGFLLADGSWDHFGQSGVLGGCAGVPESAKLGVGGFGAAMLGALWGYNGWNIISAVGAEVKDPSRTLPRALIGGSLLVIALYLLINAAFFYVLSPAEVASVPLSSSVAQEAASRFLGKSAAAVMAVGLTISAYGTLHTGMLTGPRLPFAMARAGLLPAGLGLISVRAVPAVAVVALGAWSILMSVSGTFDILTDIYIFVLWIFYGMTGASVFILRRRFPDAERPYRVWGYPVVPVLFLMVTAFLLVNTLIATPGRALAGLGLVLLGLPVYAYYARRLGAEQPAQWLGEEPPGE
jgi:APA family basic amino acid/polyamine antiporter